MMADKYDEIENAIMAFLIRLLIVCVVGAGLAIKSSADKESHKRHSETVSVRTASIQTKEVHHPKPVFTDYETIIYTEDANGNRYTV